MSPRPCYEHAGIQIFHGDCREMEWPRVPMIWTDPPYPAEFLPRYRNLSEKAADSRSHGVHCFAYAGHIHLPAVLSLMGENLTYWWIVAIIQEGSAAIMWTRGISP